METVDLPTWRCEGGGTVLTLTVHLLYVVLVFPHLRVLSSKPPPQCVGEEGDGGSERGYSLPKATYPGNGTAMEIPASDTPECAPSGVHLSSLASHILQQTPFLPKAASSEPGCLLLHEASISFRRSHVQAHFTLFSPQLKSACACLV